MAASPNRDDHDEVHGPSLREQQVLANSLAEAKPLPTSEDIQSVFAEQAKRDKTSVIQTVGNQNPWKDQLPPEEILEHMAGVLEVEEMNHGSRTIPSRPIATVDRSDRLGEDRKMVDKIEAGKASSKPLNLLKMLLKLKRLRRGSRQGKSGKGFNLGFQNC